MKPTRLMTLEGTIKRDDELDQLVWCEVQQVERDEDTRDSNRQGETWALFMSTRSTVVDPIASGEPVEQDTLIEGHDRLVVGDDVYEIVGPAWRVRNPRTSQDSHIEARGRRTE